MDAEVVGEWRVLAAPVAEDVPNELAQLQVLKQEKDLRKKERKERKRREKERAAALQADEGATAKLQQVKSDLN